MVRPLLKITIRPYQVDNIFSNSLCYGTRQLLSLIARGGARDIDLELSTSDAGL